MRFHTITGVRTGPFAAGLQLSALAFDGTNIWVADKGGNNVTRFKARNRRIGLPLHCVWALAVPMGTLRLIQHVGRALGDGQGRQAKASTGAVLGTVTVGSGTAGVVFDGTNMWS